jgi:hypothetical protein
MATALMPDLTSIAIGIRPATSTSGNVTRPARAGRGVRRVPPGSASPWARADRSPLMPRSVSNDLPRLTPGPRGPRTRRPSQDQLPRCPNLSLHGARWRRPARRRQAAPGPPSMQRGRATGAIPRRPTGPRPPAPSARARGGLSEPDRPAWWAAWRGRVIRCPGPVWRAAPRLGHCSRRSDRVIP